LIATALRAVFNMTPTPKQPTPFGIQQYNERLRDGIDFQTEVGAPACRRGMGVECQTLENSAEPQAVRVEDPSAVTGLKNKQSIFSGGGHSSDHA
jgi:hypothetical protein